MDEDFPSYELPQQTLDDLRAFLARQGIEATQQQQMYLQADMAAFGETYGHLLVTDIRIFLDMTSTPQKNLKRFVNFQREVEELQVMGLTPTSRAPKRLQIVVPDEVWDWPGIHELTYALEMDMHFALKSVRSLAELDEGLINPFSFWVKRAEASPKFWVVRDTPVSWEPAPQSPAAVAFSALQLEALCTQVLAYPEQARIRKVAARLVRHVLGGDFQLFWTEQSLTLGRRGDTQGLPLMCLSSGEKRLLAFCLFMALHHEAQDSSLCIEFAASLNGLDARRNYSAMEVLRDFVIATGALVVYRSDVERNRGMAERALAVGVKVASQAT